MFFEQAGRSLLIFTQYNYAICIVDCALTKLIIRFFKFSYRNI